VLTIVVTIGVMLSFSLEIEPQGQRAITACAARGHAASVAQAQAPAAHRYAGCFS
jgi:hypothetical protein